MGESRRMSPTVIREMKNNGKFTKLTAKMNIKKKKINRSVGNFWFIMSSVLGRLKFGFFTYFKTNG